MAVSRCNKCVYGMIRYGKLYLKIHIPSHTIVMPVTEDEIDNITLCDDGSGILNTFFDPTDSSMKPYTKSDSIFASVPDVYVPTEEEKYYPNYLDDLKFAHDAYVHDAYIPDYDANIYEDGKDDEELDEWEHYNALKHAMKN